MFKAADTDNSGSISPQELHRLVSAMNWNLEGREINYLVYVSLVYIVSLSSSLFAYLN